MRAFVLAASLAWLALLAGQALAAPVNYKELTPFLNIQLPGWEATTPTGQTVTSPVEASEALLTFVNGDMRLEMSIYDGGPALESAVAATAQPAAEGPDEVVRPMDVKGFKGTLFLHPKDNEADLVVLVPDRFVVSAHLEGGADGELLKEAVTRMDLEGLAKVGK